MPLPVSPEFPMVPFSQFDPSTPPAVPQVQVLPATGHMIPMIAAAVANEATIKANAHAARMFCYNLLVNNYWANESFAEVVKLTADYVAMQYHKGHLRMPEAGVQEAAAQVLTLFTSSLVFLYPDLKALVSPQVLDASFGNVQTLNNLKQEISSMYSHNPGHGHGGFQGGPVGGYAHTPMHPHGHMPGHPGVVAHGNYPPHLGGGGYPPGHGGYPAHHPGPAFHPGGGFQGGHGGGFGSPPAPVGLHGAATMSRLGSDPSTEAANLRQDRFFTRPQRQPEVETRREDQRYVRQETPVKPAPAPAAKTDKPTHLVIDKGSEMDRAKHQVPFLGESYLTDSQARGRWFTESTDAMVQERPAEDKETAHHVHTKLLMEPCLETAIVTGRVTQIEHQRADSSKNVFRVFAFTATPMTCIEDITPYVDNLREATSFMALVVKLKSMAASLATKTENQQYTDSVISFLNEFNMLMTELVNDFLRTKIKTSLSIDDFADDYSDLANHVQNKLGAVYSQALARFEGEAILSVLERLSDTHQQEMTALFNVPDEIFTAVFPVNYSLTYTFMNAKELGYKLGKDPVIIDAATAPSLYKIAKSLEAHKKQMEITTMHDLLITADNVRYKISRNYAKDGEFLICKA